MSSPNKVRFDESSLSPDYSEKKSLARYRELMKTFPNTLILFQNNGYLYGFEETAVVMSIWFGYRYQKKDGMLVAKGAEIHSMLSKLQTKGFRYIVDNNGHLAFRTGTGFSLPRSLSYYEKHPVSKPTPKKRKTSYTDSYSKQGGGWNDDVWAPGLPSSRFYRKR